MESACEIPDVEIVELTLMIWRPPFRCLSTGLGGARPSPCQMHPHLHAPLLSHLAQRSKTCPGAIENGYALSWINNS